MEESILISIKKLLGIDKSITDFDTDIIFNINTVFVILNQIGVGTVGFRIEDEDSTWDEFLGDIARLEMVKSYVYLKVRKLFDPPQSGTLAEAQNRMIDELEWRLSVTESFTE